jgi:hypothetical protein
MARRTHGMSRTPIYESWHQMKKRCMNPKDIAYHNYGGRGITVCERWLAFENFYADMGASFVEGLEIERLDVNGNYEPSNCTWETSKQQARNRRTNHLVTAFGETKPIIVWAEEYGIKKSTLLKRLVKYKWSPECAISIPTGSFHRWNKPDKIHA